MPLPLDNYDTDDVRSLEEDLAARQSPRDLLWSQDAWYRLVQIAFTSHAAMIAIFWAVGVAMDGKVIGAILLAGVTAFVAITFAMAVDELACLADPGWECHECQDEAERWRAWP